MSNEQWEPLEELLRQLPLRQPSANLDERVRAARPQPRTWGRRAGLGAALAATVALAAGLVWIVFHGPGGGGSDGRPGGSNGRAVASATQHPSAQYVVAQQTTERTPPAPIRIEQVWSTLAAAGVVTRGDEPPVQRLHQQVVRRVQWIDDREHVRIQWNMPSEQTVLVPLEYN
jgi:hypothetical protein